MSLREVQQLLDQLSLVFRQHELQIVQIANEKWVIWIKSLDVTLWCEADWHDLQAGKKRANRTRII